MDKIPDGPSLGGVMYQLGLMSGQLQEIHQIVKKVEDHDVRLASLEGFKNQMIGWMTAISSVVSLAMTLVYKFLHI